MYQQKEKNYVSVVLYVHNNANIIALGGRTNTYEKAISIINTFSQATYEKRHQVRLDKIKNIEGKE